jgi:hypothetical protein
MKHFDKLHFDKLYKLSNRLFGAAAVAAIMLIAVSDAWAATLPHACTLADYLLPGEPVLKRVAAAAKNKSLTITVLGTGSSILAGPKGPQSAYPARLEAALRQRLPGFEIKVESLVRSRLTARELARDMGKLVLDIRPDLVIWQTGTIDAMRRVDPDAFKLALEDGVTRLQQGGADVVLMNMQYSPRTEPMIALGPYSDTMRVVAQQRKLPLFDRLSIMRYWSDHGAVDLYAADKDNAVAYRVHNCIGQAIAALIIEAGRLQPFEQKAGK